LRLAAERLAFTMAADTQIGLSPTREKLKSALKKLDLLKLDALDTELDALEYVKLARSDMTLTSSDSPIFTFAHRRFQEYFATSVVLRDPYRVSPRQLLTDARWRETAVVLCQTQSIEILKPLLQEVQTIFKEIRDTNPHLASESLMLIDSLDQDNGTDELDGISSIVFVWPSTILHLLDLLQDGFNSRVSEIPDYIRLLAGVFLLSAHKKGILLDKKWALEVAGIAPQSILLWMIRHALANRSQWIKDTAYQQVARLGDIPSDVAAWIRKSLIRLSSSGRLRRERYTTSAYLSRLAQSAEFLVAHKLLLIIPSIDIIAHLLLLLLPAIFGLRNIPSIPLINGYESFTDVVNRFIESGYLNLIVILILIRVSIYMSSILYSSVDITRNNFILISSVLICVASRMFIILIAMLFVYHFSFVSEYQRELDERWTRNPCPGVPRS
jgi:hypothetical protein